MGGISVLSKTVMPPCINIPMRRAWSVGPAIKSRVGQRSNTLKPEVSGNKKRWLNVPSFQCFYLSGIGRRFDLRAFKKMAVRPDKPHPDRRFL